MMSAYALVCQEVTATLVGTVLDPTGSPIPAAQVRIRSIDLNLDVRTLSTGEDGGFVATLLPIGNYEVRVEMRGFKPYTQRAIELHVSDRLTLRISLQVGELSESVTVEESPPAVELQSPVAAGLISGQEVRELSLNNRNYIQLLTLMPGVTSNAATDEVYIGTTNPTGGTNTIPFSMNGGRTSGNNFMVDGADNVDRGSNLTLLNYPSVDAIAEFKALRGQYSAEFGRGAAGQINVITKSGASKWHGSAYEFNRNDKLAANNFFNNLRNINRPPLRYNNFGYTFSGPVPVWGYKSREKNKTFFFWSQEFRRVITYSTFNALAPTEDMKQGRFSSPVCLEFAGNDCVAPTNEIRSNISPVARAYLSDIWSKIPGGDARTFNLFTPQKSLYNHRQELIKIDHIFTPSQQLSVRFLNDTIPTEEPGGLFTGAALPGVSTTATNSPGRNWTVRFTSTLSPSLLNEAGWSYSYGAITSDVKGLVGTANSPNIKVNLPFPSTLNRVPTLSVSGLSSVTGFGPYLDFNRNHNIFDNVTKLFSRHTVKVGVSINLYQKTENAAGNNTGTFSIQGAPRISTTPVAQQAWANFLLGKVATFTQASLDIFPDVRQRQFEAYVQDDIRVRSNLTVNVGVRYSNFRSPYDASGLLTNFDYTRWDPAKAPQVNAATGNIVPNTGDPLNGVVVNGGNSPWGQKVTNEDGKKFAPRVGFAWDPFKKGRTALRGGYGISFDSTLVAIYEQNIFNNPPFVNNVTISNTLLDNPRAGVEVISAAPKTLRGTPIPNQIPYTQQWSFDIQQQVGRTVMAVGYYGSKSTHLLGVVDLNQVQPGAGVAAGITTAQSPITATNTPRLNTLRPYRGYAAINTVQNWFNSNYHALQFSSQTRLSGSSSFRTAYSFSKVLTDATSDRSNAPQNTYNRAADYARASFDRTHVLTLSYIYYLPFAKQSKGFVGAALKGWQLSGITTFNSGLPLRVTSGLGLDWGGLGLLGTSASSPRPDRIADPNANAPHTILNWFNTAAFAAVPTGEVRPGNAAATTVIGPGYQRWDVSLFKNFTIREGWRMQFRTETFNFVNHTNYQAVSTSLGATNFGQVTTSRDPRRVQLGLKLTF
jgi:hypothetical protein